MERKLRIIAALAVVAAGLGAAVEAQGQQVDFVVQAGAISPTNPDRPYEYTRYYPEQLQVHRGDTVGWDFIGTDILGFHTVTFSPEEAPGLWRADEVPDTYAWPERSFFGSGCGRGTSAACVLDDDQAFLSSGVPVIPPAGSMFRVTIDLPPGTYEYFCTIHASMRGSIEVVDGSAPVATRDEIDVIVEDQIAVDTDAADDRWDEGQQPRSAMEDGQRVWSVWLGDSTDDDHVALIGYLPSSLPGVSAGDKVRFEYRDRTVGPIIDEVHTVTFPQELGVQGPGATFYPSCDPDHPATGAKGIPGGWGFAGPDCPFNSELLWQSRMQTGAPAPGNLVLHESTLHDSGALVPEGAPDTFRNLPDTGRTLPSSFEAEFPGGGTFRFACSVHERIMTGSITVA